MIVLSMGALSAVAACNGCQPKDTKIVSNGDEKATLPTVRLYLVSDLAGALEPCGCVKDQLGGMDHFGALVRGEEAKAPAYATVSAGPLFFMDPDLEAQKRGQDLAKAETIADALASVKLAAFAPARNEWAGGAEVLETLKKKSGAELLFANGEGTAPKTAVTVRDIGGLKVGFLGVASPSKAKEGKPLADVKDGPLQAAVAAGLAQLEKQGAQTTVVLAAVGRGEAKRLADAFPKLLAILVGSPGGAGEANTQAPPAEQVGQVLIVETGNHLQTVGVLDLYVREKSLTFADGTGLEVTRKREALAARIDELRKKIASWEADPSIAKADVDARRTEMQKLEAERATLDKTPAPEKGSFYRFALREVRTSLGKDAAMTEKLSGYYKRVNEDNQRAFANKMPPAAGKDEATYVGVDACSTCHQGPRKVWDATAHGHAYKTLADQFKEFNLDCVSCHVTGYEKPGGSTVTFVKNLKDVQCETCHGPGSKHMKAPEKVAVPIPKPQPDACLQCHHAPHVHEFDAPSKMSQILGKGHEKK